ncbi:hypothetical protein PZA11_005281 [Diplocarpon coronariae]|nr:hypothetical protein JHW43_007541 [Diplocarpon mali]
MYFPSVLLAAAIPLAIANPVPRANKASCETEELSSATWKTLGIDKWLAGWTTSNYTATPTNQVQALADSFGAPNFFCGLDNFCNAGQPCSPVQLPSWYALVAIQNWNSYMNSINTAISFASSIISMTLPSIVADFHQPPDDTTPLEAMMKLTTMIVGVIPGVGGQVLANANTLLSMITFPTQSETTFLQWSDVSSSLATVVTDWQAAVSDAFKATIDADPSSKQGINTIVSGGSFLGVSKNFTQDELQATVIDSLKLYSVSLALQAEKVYVYRGAAYSSCKEASSAEYCVEGRKHILAKGPEGQDAYVDTLINKYGMTKDRIFLGTISCFEKNGKKQLADGFADSVPIDSNAECLFNVQVCLNDQPKDGMVDDCRALGLNI